MEQELREIQKEIEELHAVSQDTNRVVHRMRRGQRAATLLRLVWWALVLGVGAYGYIAFVQPQVDALTAAYGSAKDFQLQIQNFFAQFGRTNAAPGN